MSLSLAVQAEKEYIRLQYQNQLKGSLVEQRRAGIALFPLKIESQETRGSFIQFSFSTSFPINDAFFRKGCSVICKQNDWQSKGRIQFLTETYGEITVESEEVPNLLESPVSLHFVPDDRTLLCMEIGARLYDESPKIQTFQKSFKLQSDVVSFNDERLNTNQQLALETILSSQLAVAIQGPPGTGKTHTLAIAIEQLVSQHKKVILSAPSNTAVDNLCHQLIALKVPFLRVGNEEKMSSQVEPFTSDGYLEKGTEKALAQHLQKSLKKAEQEANTYVRNVTSETISNRKQAQIEVRKLRKEIRTLNHTTQEKLLDTIPVIAGTPVGLFNTLPKLFERDVVIIDEAGQALEPLTWLVASFGKRLVICGDPQQLPPVVFSPKAIQLGLNQSVLEKICVQQQAIVLNDQYRMALQIVNAINPYFYGNELNTVHSERTGKLLFIDMAGFGEGEEIDETTGSTFNRDEAKAVSQLIKHFELKPQSTTILSPYTAQLNELKNVLEKTYKVSTIDAIQGQEQDTIVISLTRSNSEQKIGFLSDYRRMNVAISRAKTTCVIVGDSSTLGGDSFYSQLIDGIEQQGGYHSIWEFQ